MIPNLIKVEEQVPLYYSQSAQDWIPLPQLFLAGMNDFRIRYEDEQHGTYILAVLAGVSRLLNILGKLNRMQGWLRLDDALLAQSSNKHIYQHLKAKGKLQFYDANVVEVANRQKRLWELQSVRIDEDTLSAKEQLWQAIQDFKPYIVQHIEDTLDSMVEDTTPDEVAGYIEVFSKQNILDDISREMLADASVWFPEWYRQQLDYDRYHSSFKVQWMLSYHKQTCKATDEVLFLNSIVQQLKQQTQTV